MALALLTFTIVAVATALQSVTGFGYALLVAPVFAAAMGPKQAVVTMTLIGVPMTIMNAVRWRADLDRRAALTVSVSGLAGMPLGLWVLRAADDRSLTLIMAGVVLILTAALWRGLTVPPGASTEIAAGVVSGALATSTGTNGPPLVVAFHAAGMPAETFRATLAAAFTVLNGAALLGFFVQDLVTRDAGRLALVGVPAAVLGAVAGDLVFARLDAARFRTGVLVVLAATGVLVGGRALFLG